MPAVTQLPESRYAPPLTEPAASPPRIDPGADAAPRWRPATILAFRICFVYFGLYVLTTQMLPEMLPIPALGFVYATLMPPETLVAWVGGHVLGIAHPIASASTGSGDKTFDWVQAFSLLLVAISATIVWSVAARGTHSHPRMYKWFRLFLRFALGTTMLSYGMAKVIPMQMPILTLKRLVEPFGNFSPMGVLWYSVGASPAYEIFVGSAEVGAALLLFIPRTAALGALVCLMDVIGVFTMNMTYDVPVKLFSFHLILMSLFLIGPNAPRLFDLFIRQRSTNVVGEPELGGSDRARRVSLVLQVAFAVCVIANQVYSSVGGWKQFGGGAPKSALFGIWDVRQMTVDGQERLPLLSDSTRWRRVLFQRPTGATFQRPNDTFKDYQAVVDTTAKTIALTDSVKARSKLNYQRPSKDLLILDGTMDGRPVHLELAYRDPDSFVQRSRGFHWIQERPFQR